MEQTEHSFTGLRPSFWTAFDPSAYGLHLRDYCNDGKWMRGVPVAICDLVPLL